MKYQIINIKTIVTDNDLEAGLSFFEGEHDIPFKIERLYCVYENKKLKGFHPNKQSGQLMFCPYGAIEILVDDGDRREAVLLNSPSVGIILPPGIWREITWKKSDSVLCVAASGHYEPEKLQDNYELYIEAVRSRKITKQKNVLEG